MKKRRILSIVLTIAVIFAIYPLESVRVLADSGEISINKDNFPDSNFRTYVKSKIDRNKDTLLSIEEREAVIDIDVEDLGIVDLTGIEYFKNLTGLYCSRNQLEKLDVSKNLELVQIICPENRIKELDVTENKKLESLICNSNQLSSLELNGMFDETSNTSDIVLSNQKLEPIGAVEKEDHYELDLKMMFGPSLLKRISNVQGMGITYSPEKGIVSIVKTNGNKGKLSYDFDTKSGYAQVRYMRVELNWDATTPTYTVNFDNNGGLGIMDNLVIPRGMKYTLPANSLTPPKDKVFDYWEIDSKKYNVGEKFTVVKNVTVKAIWKKKTAPFPSVPGGGTLVPIDKVPEITINDAEGKAVYNSEEEILTIIPKEGYQVEEVLVNGQKKGKVEILNAIKTSDKVTVLFSKIHEKQEIDKETLQNKIEKVKLITTTKFTKNNNIRVKAKIIQGAEELRAIQNMGVMVEYKFYRSTSKYKKFHKAMAKQRKVYYNTYGKKGQRYYYRTKLVLKDKEGKVLLSTKLRDSRYGTRVWSK